MGVLLFVFWVVFNGRLTAEIAVFGLVLAAGLYLFLCLFLNYRLYYDWLLLKALPLLVEYVLILIREIALANWVMAGFIFTAKQEAEPAIVSFRTPLRTRMGQVLLANSITLTPGTITVDLTKGEYQVH